MSKKDYFLGALAGFLIGLLAMPVLNAGNSELYVRFGIYLIPFFLIATPLGLWVAKLISLKVAVVWQIGKFGVSGVLNTFLDWGVLAFLTYIFSTRYAVDTEKVIFAGITFYAVFKGIAFIIANINSYYWNKFWTFAAVTSKKTREEYMQFLLVSLIGFLLNTGLATLVFKFMVSGSLMNKSQAEIFGAAVGSVVVFIWNFLGYKFIVFKPKLQPTTYSR